MTQSIRWFSELGMADLEQVGGKNAYQGEMVSNHSALGVAVPWTDEVSRYLFLAEIFLGSVLALRYQEHIRITVVTDLLPAGAQRWAAVAADAISILVLLMIMGGAFNMMERTAGIFASTFDMSFSYLYLMQLVAAGLMALLLVEDLVVRLCGKPPTLPDEPKE